MWAEHLIDLKTIFTFPFPHFSYIFWNLRFASVSRSNHWEKHNWVQRMEMEETLENHDLSKQNVEIPMKKAEQIIKSNKCNQCDFASSWVSSLRTHLKTHSGEKSTKCNQCDYESSRADNLRAHLKTHSGEKTNKCNQCDYASTSAGDLRRHLKIHSGEKPN